MFLIILMSLINYLQGFLNESKSKKEIFKVKQYVKAITALKKENINTFEQAKIVLLKEFTNPKSILEKTQAYFEQKSSIPKIKGSVNRSNLNRVPGIGPSFANKLIKQGIKTVSNLKKQKSVLTTKAQQLGLKYLNNIEQRIPRKEIVKFEGILKKMDINFIIAGSYRRGCITSGDIDVIINSNDQNDLKKLVSILEEKGILLDNFAYGTKKYNGYGKIDKVVRRIDILHTTPDEYPYAILYFTGSKDFNKWMRNIALKKGFSLNEKGIYQNNNKLQLHIKNERDIFKFFDLEYVDPVNRANAPIDTRFTSVMLAEIYNPESHNPVGYYMSEKYDGIRAIWTGTKLVTRNMKEISVPKWFVENLPKNVIIDGELFIDRKSFQKVGSTVMKKTPIDSEWNRIKFMMFDIISSNAEYDIRQELLQNIVTTLNSNKYVYVKQTLVESKEQLEAFYKKVIDSGGEGIILRKGPYLQKRSRNMLKYKPVIDSEAIVNSVVEGKGKYKGMMGALKVHLKTNESIKFQIGTGFNDSLRKKIYENKNKWIGKEITFAYRDKTDSNIPRFPSYIRTPIQ